MIPTVEQVTDDGNETSAGTDAAADVTTVEAATSETVTLPLVTVDSNQTVSIDNDTTTDADEVSTVPVTSISGEPTIAPGTTIGSEEEFLWNGLLHVQNFNPKSINDELYILSVLFCLFACRMSDNHFLFQLITEFSFDFFYFF